jgi:hydroxyacylglutathione hydrolase
MSNSVLRLDLRFVNVYLLQAGEQYILIDTGIAEVWTQLETALMKMGVLPDKLKLVILTHGDKDHAGNGYILQHRYGIKISMHKADLEMVKNGQPQQRHGSNMAGKFSIWFDKRVASGFTCFEPDLFLSDEQNLESFGLFAKIMHTPGHTRGSISILTSTGELFVGDTFTNRKKPLPAHIIQNDQELKVSLSKLTSTQARMVYPGHGKPFKFEELI